MFWVGNGSMDNIKAFRLRNHLSQFQLAEALKVTQACVSRWEHGKSVPEVEVAINMSELLKISLDEIYENPHRNGPFLTAIYDTISSSGEKHVCGKAGCLLQLSIEEMRMLFPRALRKEGVTPTIVPSDFFGYYVEDASMVPNVLPNTINVIYKTNKIIDNAIHLVNIDDEVSRLVRLTNNSSSVWALLDATTGENRVFSSRDIKNGHLQIRGVVVQSRQNFLL